VFVKYFALNLIEANKIFPILVPSLLFILIGLALFTDQWNSERVFREAYLMIFCLITVIGYSAAVVQMRYFYVLLPIFFVWIARGSLKWSEWARRMVPDRLSSRLFTTQRAVALCILAVFLYVLPLNFYMRPADDAWSSRAYEERDAGLWLRQADKSSPLIFSASFRPVFYAQGRPLTPKTKELSEITDYILTNRADYVVTSDRSLKRHPYLKDLDGLLQHDPRYERVYDNRDKAGYRISIFRVRSK
jgi:hypothetical protein